MIFLRIILSAAIILVISGCNHRTADSKLLFSAMERKESPAVGSMADTLFHYAVPIAWDIESELVYLLDGNCSFCIANAIDCYNTLYRTGNKIPFFYLLRSDESDLFLYYYKQNEYPKAEYFTLLEPLNLKDGLYTIKHGIVSGYSPWRKK